MKYIHSPALDECKAGPKWLVKLRYDRKNIVLALTSFEAKDHTQAIRIAKIRAEMAQQEAPVVTSTWGNFVGADWEFGTPENRKKFGVDGWFANDNIILEDGTPIGRIAS
jgi:hypothetical protein